MSKNKLKVFIYYYYEYKQYLYTPTKKIINTSDAKMILLSRSLKRDVSGLNSIYGNIVYSTSELSEILSFESYRPRIIKFYKTQEFQKCDPESYGFPFGFPDLAYSSHSYIESFFENYSVDLEKSWNEVFTKMIDDLKSLGSITFGFGLPDLQKRLYTYDF